MGYDDIPWIFRGRALYQLQLVKSKIARQYIPPELKLVELFGHTLGGFYLARYTDSPAGAFDELVVMSGLVWNAPTSCAWAARVYVNNKEARNHGLKHVGLPSRLAQFIASPSRRLQSHWWKSYSPSPGALSVKNIERRGWLSKGRGLKPSVCTFLLDDDHSHDTKRGPRMKLTLPSFSGCTLEIPKLLKYACQLETNIRPVRPMELKFDVDEDSENDELMKGVLQGRKVCAFVFDEMTMTVNPPIEIEYSQPPRHELHDWIGFHQRKHDQQKFEKLLLSDRRIVEDRHLVALRIHQLVRSSLIYPNPSQIALQVFQLLHTLTKAPPFLWRLQDNPSTLT